MSGNNNNDELGFKIRRLLQLIDDYLQENTDYGIQQQLNALRVRVNQISNSNQLNICEKELKVIRDRIVNSIKITSQAKIGQIGYNVNRLLKQPISDTDRKLLTKWWAKLSELNNILNIAANITTLKEVKRLIKKLERHITVTREALARSQNAPPRDERVERRRAAKTQPFKECREYIINYLKKYVYLMEIRGRRNQTEYDRIFGNVDVLEAYTRMVDGFLKDALRGRALMNLCKQLKMNESDDEETLRDVVEKFKSHMKTYYPIFHERLLRSTGRSETDVEFIKDSIERPNITGQMKYDAVDQIQRDRIFVFFYLCILSRLRSNDVFDWQFLSDYRVRQLRKTIEQERFGGLHFEFARGSGEIKNNITRLFNLFIDFMFNDWDDAEKRVGYLKKTTLDSKGETAKFDKSASDNAIFGQRITDLSPELMRDPNMQNLCNNLNLRDKFLAWLKTKGHDDMIRFLQNYDNQGQFNLNRFGSRSSSYSSFFSSSNLSSLSDFSDNNSFGDSSFGDSSFGGSSFSSGMSDLSSNISDMSYMSSNF